MSIGPRVRLARSPRAREAIARQACSGLYGVSRGSAAPGHAMLSSLLSPTRGGRRAPGAAALLFAAVLSILGAAPAGATGSLDCAIDDKAVEFNAHIVFSHGLAAAFTNQQFELKLKAKGAPEDFKDLALDAAALTHHWFHGKELKLHLYHERTQGRHGSVELVIETREARKPEDEGSFAGTYRLEVSDLPEGQSEAKTWVYKGKAACSAG